jgi:hypothetical protein
MECNKPATRRRIGEREWNQVAVLDTRPRGGKDPWPRSAGLDLHRRGAVGGPCGEDCLAHSTAKRQPFIAMLAGPQQSKVGRELPVAVRMLTMTRGSDTGRPHEIDEVMALPTGWIARIASAPSIAAPGSEFRYDDGGAHLLGAALARLVGMPLSEYAATGHNSVALAEGP